jgi:hypothetical protein
MFGKSSRRNRLTSSVCESMESLEVRRVPVGNITAALQNGVLTITGDNAANDVELQGNLSNRVTIAGFNQTIVNGVAPVNGKSVVGFAGVTDVVIVTKDGNDKIVVKGNPDPVRFRDITIDSGAGDDIVEIRNVIATDDINVTTQNGKGSSDTGGGERWWSGVDSNQNDVNINTARTGGSAPDNDTVQFVDVSVKRDVSIQTGADVDVVQLFDPRILNPFLARFAQPTDIADDLTIDTGDAGDQVTLNRVNVVDEINIELRDGNDTLSVVRTTADEFNADGGSGQDTLFLLDNLFANFDEDSFEL